MGTCIKIVPIFRCQFMRYSIPIIERSRYRHITSRIRDELKMNSFPFSSVNRCCYHMFATSYKWPKYAVFYQVQTYLLKEPSLRFVDLSSPSRRLRVALFPTVIKYNIDNPINVIITKKRMSLVAFSFRRNRRANPADCGITKTCKNRQRLSYSRIRLWL